MLLLCEGSAFGNDSHEKDLLRCCQLKVWTETQVVWFINWVICLFRNILDSN